MIFKLFFNGVRRTESGAFVREHICTVVWINHEWNLESRIPELRAELEASGLEEVVLSDCFNISSENYTDNN